MHESESEVSQLCPTLSDPMDYSLPGSSVHGIFQARVLEWDAIAFSASDLKCDQKAEMSDFLVFSNWYSLLAGLFQLILWVLGISKT